MINPGTVLGQRYRLEERIASGCMGDVWRGVDEVLGRTVAVKFLLPSLLEEPTGLRRSDVTIGTAANLRCDGKGRKQRCTPLTAHTVSVLRVWLHERGGGPDDPLFPGPRGMPLSRDAVRALVARHTSAATVTCPSLRNKQVSPHVLRHTCAMRLLESGVDTAVIALWLGHESTRTTDLYLHADLGLKERALALTAPPHSKRGRYRPPDPLLAFLEAL